MTDWRVAALQEIRRLADAGDFTSDDVHEAVGDPVHYNSVGQVFNEAEHLGIIERTGEYKKSKRPSAKGRRIPVWTKKRVEALF